MWFIEDPPTHAYEFNRFIPLNVSLGHNQINIYIKIKAFNYFKSVTTSTFANNKWMSANGQSKCIDLYVWGLKYFSLSQN